MSIDSACARIESADHTAVLAKIADRARRTLVADFTQEWLLGALQTREQIASTSTPEGVAFPHAICDEFQPANSRVIVATLAHPVQWGTHRVAIVVALFGSKAQPWRHVRTLARVARVCSQADVRQCLMECATDDDLLSLFMKECNSHE